MITYVFVDIDGVLRKKSDPKNQLNKVLADTLLSFVKAENLSLVVASSWRIGYSRKELMNFFPEKLRASIVYITPEHPDPNVDFVRERECMAWLRANAETPCYYVALDDDSSLYKSFPLALVDPDEGIDVKSLDQIKAARKQFGM